MIRFSTRKAAPFVMMDKVVETIFSELNLEFHVPGIWVHERLAQLLYDMEALQAFIRSEEKRESKNTRRRTLWTCRSHPQCLLGPFP